MSEESELSSVLRQLKQRSGRSYTALAHRTGLSRSSLHRYCQGGSVPADFGTVERIARSCGAAPEEIDRLYAAWSRESEAARDAPGGTAAPAGDGDGRAAGTAAAPSAGPGRNAEAPSGAGVPSGTGVLSGTGVPSGAESGPVPLPGGRSAWTRRLLLPLLAVVCMVVGVSPAERLPVHTGSSAGSGAPGRPYVGAQWALTPTPLDPDFFGMTMNTNTGRTPDFRVGALRLWDSQTRWSQLQPDRDRFDWTVLKRAVTSAERDDLPVVLTFGGTPEWAAPEGDLTPYGDGSRSAPPDDPDDWDRFVRKVADRYRGRISAYELWDNVGNESFYSGDMDTLAGMVRRASRIIHAADQDADVVCPSFGNLWQPRGRALMREFIRTGVYKYCDAAGVKLHPRKAGGPPEEIIELAFKVDDLFYREGDGMSLWNTGPGKDIVTTPPLDARKAEDYAVRFYLAGMYARRPRVTRMFFYAWGGTTGLPLVVQPAGGEPTEAGRRIGRLQEWIDGTGIVSCATGAAVRLPAGVHECLFRTEDEDPAAWYAIRWTQDGEATAEATGAHGLRRMDGSTEHLRSGDRIVYGQSPVLVEYRSDPHGSG